MVKVRVVLYYRADSVPPDNPCPKQSRWRGMTRVHVSDHAGVSEQ